MNDKISSIRAMEILDSRGNPTVRVYVQLENGITATASVPSGASTGENKALELRDGDDKRYAGKGVLKAVANVCEKIAPLLNGIPAHQQAKIDYAMPLYTRQRYFYCYRFCCQLFFNFRRSI